MKENILKITNPENLGSNENKETDASSHDLKNPFTDLAEAYGEEIQKDKEMFYTTGLQVKEVSEKDATPNEHGEHDLPFGITP